MNSTEYQVQQLQLWVKELETRLLQLEDRVVFNPPTRPEPAFHGFMDKENCTVNLCFTPQAPGGPNNTYATAYYTSPPAPKSWTKLTTAEIDDLLVNTHPENRWTLVERAQAKLQEKNT